MTKEVVAKLNHLHIAPRKVRLVAYAIKGLTANEAEAQLLFRPQRSSKDLLALLRSAVANAKNNFKLNPDNLFVKAVRVDQGPTLKRFLPRAMGRATPLHKKTCHVVLILSEMPQSKAARFNIAVVKKSKKTKEAKAVKPKSEIKESPVKKAGEKKPGFFKKIFNRKSV